MIVVVLIINSINNNNNDIERIADDIDDAYFAFLLLMIDSNHCYHQLLRQVLYCYHRHHLPIDEKHKKDHQYYRT